MKLMECIVQKACQNNIGITRYLINIFASPDASQVNNSEKIINEYYPLFTLTKPSITYCQIWLQVWLSKILWVLVFSEELMFTLFFHNVLLVHNFDTFENVSLEATNGKK